MSKNKKALITTINAIEDRKERNTCTMHHILNYFDILLVQWSPAQPFILCLKGAIVGSYFMLSSSGRPSGYAKYSVNTLG